jgi:gluconolactonase
MLQPNDLALSALHPKLIYLSGQNFSADTTAGASGDLWTCNGNGNGSSSSTASRFPPSLLAAADIHRTNGIETSPDGRSLYLSSATNVGGEVVANRIYRFATDESTGALLQQPPPTAFFNFTGAEAAVDIDGMRVDVHGNLFVTRNGAGRVVKISPEGQLLQVIALPGMGGPSNLEFGGAGGTTLFAVGKCAANATVGCAASFETDESVGKAFANLQ